MNETLQLPAAVLEGLPEKWSQPLDVEALYRLLDDLTEREGPHLAALVPALEAELHRGDEWSELFAFAALRLTKRLHPAQPSEAAHWLERARVVSEPCHTQTTATNWGLAVFRTVRRAGEKDPSRLLQVSRELLAQATKWGERALITNTLDLTLSAAYALGDVGRDEESAALCEQALEIKRTPGDLGQQWWAMRFARQRGLVERRRKNYGEAIRWYEQARALWAPKLFKAPGELAWLLAELLHVARLEQRPEEVLRRADDFERELGDSKDVVVKEEAEFVRAERAQALVMLGRLDEVEPTLERLPAKPVMIATRALVAQVKVMLAEARGDRPEAHRLALKALKTFAGAEADCHDNLDFFHATVSRGR